MKIAIPFENENIFGHFGHASAFKLYEVENNKISTVKILPTLGSGHDVLVGFLASEDVDTLICGGIGGGALEALKDAGIAVYGGVTGNADIAVHNYLCGKLAYDNDAHCDCHDGKHEHSCGSGGCGSCQS